MINEFLSQAASNPAVLAGLAMYAGSQRGGAGPMAGIGQGLYAYGAAMRDQQQAALEQRRADASVGYTQALTEDTQDRREARKQKREQEQQQLQVQQQTVDQLEAQFGPMAAQIARAYGIGPALQLYGNQQLQEHRGDTLAERQRHNVAIESRAGRSGGGGASGGTGGASKRKTPTPSQIIEEPLSDGTFQKHKYNAELGGYETFGAPYKKGRDSMSSFFDPTNIPAAGPQPYNPQPIAGAPGSNAPAMIPQRPNLQGRDLLMPKPYSAQGGSSQPQPSRQAGAPAGTSGEMEQDFQQARQLIQANPQMAGEINRRLQQKYGRSL